MSPTQAPLLSVRALRMAFAGREVVHGLDFDMAPGEKLALVGESGSGKTVTALGLLGLAQGATIQGRALFSAAGGSVDLLKLTESRLRGLRGQEIAMIFQEPMTALNPVLTIGEQIAEVLRLKQACTPKHAAQGALDLIASTGIDAPAQRAKAYPHQLSGGQRQRAMIAMALACKPKLLLADEPTTALDATVRQQILELLETLQQANGMAILLITHDLHLVRRFADRVAVMQSGHLVEHGAVNAVLSNPQHAYTRHLLNSAPKRHVMPRLQDAPVVMAGRDLTVEFPTAAAGVRGWFRKDRFTAVNAVSFQVFKGQTLGVVGESGSGKTTLALAALGLLPFLGHLDVGGLTWGQNRRSDLVLRQRVQVVFQDPFASLSPRMTLEEIVGEGLVVHAPHQSASERRLQILAALHAVGLNEAAFPGLLGRYPHQFSGGQRQRIAIARALVVDPQMLVLDEPTSALDATLSKQVLELLQALQRERGLSYVLITHDVGVISAMAHHVLVMQSGRMVEYAETEAVLTSPQHPYTQTLLASAR